MLTPNPEPVRCSSCKAPMRLVHVVPRLGGMAELHSYECSVCRAIQTRVADDKLYAAVSGGSVAKGSNIGG